MLEFIATLIIESLPKLIGTLVRWCFYLGRKPFSDVFNEEWNKRVGIVIIGIIIGLIVLFNN
jgi:hypothetical protein